MDIDDRMKAYEEANRHKLTPRTPAVMRLDGKSFHTLTKHCQKPYDLKLRNDLVESVKELLNEVPARFAYHQSDEISLLLIDYNKFNSQQWFDGKIEKMVSVAASIMGAEFSLRWSKPGYFDARIFNVPERDVKNYFIWRQQDCMRNAVSMVAQASFSPKQLNLKNTQQKIQMLAEKGVDFHSTPDWFKFGTIITRTNMYAAPEFLKDREHLDAFLTIEEQ